MTLRKYRPRPVEILEFDGSDASELDAFLSGTATTLVDVDGVWTLDAHDGMPVQEVELPVRLMRPGGSVNVSILSDDAMSEYEQQNELVE